MAYFFFLATFFAISGFYFFAFCYLDMFFGLESYLFTSEPFDFGFGFDLDLDAIGGL